MIVYVFFVHKKSVSKRKVSIFIKNKNLKKPKKKHFWWFFFGFLGWVFYCQLFRTSRKNNLKNHQLAVEVLTSKACSEEGLEDVTALLLNLSYGGTRTREAILRLLLAGARELGHVVSGHVSALLSELADIKAGLGKTRV